MPLDSPTLDLGKLGIAVSGFLAFGPLGTDLPSDFTAEMDPDIRQAGYLSEEGLKLVFDESRDSIPLWQNRASLEVTTDAKVMYEGSFAETGKVAVTEFWYGTTVTQGAEFGSYTIRPGRTSGRGVGVFLEIFSDGNRRLTTSTDCEIFRNGDAESLATNATFLPFQVVLYDEPKVYDTRLKTPA